MKKEDAWLYKAGFNEEVGNRFLRVFKVIFNIGFIVVGIWGIFTLIYVLGSIRIQRDLETSVECTFYGCNNFNTKLIRDAYEINIDDVEELPLNKEVIIKPQIYNAKYFKFSPRISSTTDFELHVKGPVWWHYEEFLRERGPLDSKYIYRINSLSRGYLPWKEGENEDNCYLIRWWPRSNFRSNGIEFFEGENPNNCETIIFSHSDFNQNVEGYFEFVLDSENTNKTVTIEAQYRQFDWNRQVE